MEHSDYILSKINKAMVSNHPFPHFIIHDFLPQELYNKLVQANNNLANDNLHAIEKIEIPEQGFEKPTAENVHKAGTITYNMYKADDVHAEVESLLSDVKVKELILNKFNIKQEAHGGAELVREINIDLKPHTDDWREFVVHFQLYCPIDDSHSNLGVKILEKNEDSFTEVKQISYVPNVVWCIKPGDDSWHKVEPIKDMTEFNRDSITMRYFAS